MKIGVLNPSWLYGGFGWHLYMLRRAGVHIIRREYATLPKRFGVGFDA